MTQDLEVSEDRRGNIRTSYIQQGDIAITYNKNVVITPNPTRELECTVDLFDELIGTGIYMF